jgi:hypothetical protein
MTTSPPLGAFFIRKATGVMHAQASPAVTMYPSAISFASGHPAHKDANDRHRSKVAKPPVDKVNPACFGTQGRSFKWHLPFDYAIPYRIVSYR